MYFPVSGWFAAFMVTILVEIPVATFLLRDSGTDPRRLVVLVVLANLVTHPALWYVIPQLLPVGSVRYTVAGEAWAVGAEALFYWAAIKGLRARRAIGVALVANLASFIVGRAFVAISPDLFR